MDKGSTNVTERELELVEKLFGARLDALEHQLKKWGAIGLLGGNAVAGLVAAFVTRTTPSDVATSLQHIVVSVLS